MSEIKQYVDILTESLRKKKQILDAILEKNEEQAEAVKSKGSLDEFDRIVGEKAELIRTLDHLDSGFTKVYDRIGAQLLAEREAYRDEIRGLQELISQVTDQSIKIQASEKRNKALVENYFAYTREQIHSSRKSVKAASDYYRSMNRVNYVDPQLMDQKK